MRARVTVVLLAVLAMLLVWSASASAGPNDLIGDEGPGCAAGASHHSGTATVQGFLSQEVKAVYSWCAAKNGTITWWKRPTLNVVSDVPFGGALESVKIENPVNSDVERKVPEIATYTFTAVQSIFHVSGAEQRFEMTLTVNGTVGMTSLCMGKTCDREVD